jgi:hypothetical protein
MPEPSDDEVDYLLSRGGLSGDKRDQILQNVLSSTAAQPVPARRRWWAWGGGMGLALTAGAAAILLWPRAQQPSADFRAKGAPDPAVLLGMACLGATVKACPRGALVAFTLDGANGTGDGAGRFVSAYADPVPGGERIWYLTNEPLVDGIVSKAARVGDEHAPGPYRVKAMLTTQALPRDVLVGGADAAVVARATFDLEVIP